MLCPEGFLLSASFYEVFHTIRSDAVHAAFLELPQPQCETIMQSLSTKLVSMFEFISPCHHAEGPVTVDFITGPHERPEHSAAAPSSASMACAKRLIKEKITAPLASGSSQRPLQTSVKIWTCGQCSAHVANHTDVSSKSFQGAVQCLFGLTITQCIQNARNN
jgi:hypothetical protein